VTAQPQHKEKYNRFVNDIEILDGELRYSDRQEEKSAFVAKATATSTASETATAIDAGTITMTVVRMCFTE
jgi:hypothetical protein